MIRTAIKKKLSQNIENSFKKLWENAPQQPAFIKERGFDKLNEGFFPGSLLFVGINPAYSEKPIKERDSEKTYPYFQHIEDAAKRCGYGDNFSVIDVLAIRCTKLKDIKDAINNRPDVKDFCVEQFKIFKASVKEIKPSVIWVCNAYAREWIINKEFNPEAFTVKYDEITGVHYIQDSGLKYTPIIFSGMLGGSHPMDKGSRDEHEWKIRFLKKKKRCL